MSRASVLSTLLVVPAALTALTACEPPPASTPAVIAPTPAPVETPEPAPKPLVPGGPCVTEGKEKCLSKTDALACHGGAWEALTCKSAEGCSNVKGEDQCVQTTVQENDTCNLPGDFLCRADGTAMLTCVKENHRWTLSQGCLGERKCTLEAKKVTCDNSLAKLDDACREDGDYACALPDQKTALACKQGKFVLASHCKGPKGCRIGGDKASGFKVECDDSIAFEGDVCEKEGHFSCASDATRILVCKGGKMVADDKCKHREKCSVRGAQVGCFR